MHTARPHDGGAPGIEANIRFKGRGSGQDFEGAERRQIINDVKVDAGVPDRLPKGVGPDKVSLRLGIRRRALSGPFKKATCGVVAIRYCFGR